jgi:hypothetical protein
MCRNAFVSLFFCAAVSAAPISEPAQPKVPEELLKARLAAVRQVFAAAREEALAGRGTIDDMPVWSQRLLEAERALATTKAEHVAACRQHLERMQEFEKMQKARFDAGRIAVKDFAAATYHRADAAVVLARVEGMK